MCQDVFFLFTLTSKTQLRAFLSVLYVLSMDASRLWTLQCACADLVCVSLSLMGAHAGSGWWSSGMDWLGACPGGARPDFILTVNIH